MPRGSNAHPLPEVGAQFGLLTVIGIASPSPQRTRRVLCICACRRIYPVEVFRLIAGRAVGCASCVLKQDAARRFWARVEANDNGCWLWTGTINQYGYAMFSEDNRRSLNAHRWAYLHFRGPIPEGQQIDHLCRIRHCVNPDHLEAVGVRENLLRGRRPNTHLRQMTHCPNGHLYSPENTVITEYGKRTCLTCKTEGDRRSAERLREKRRAQKAGT